MYRGTERLPNTQARRIERSKALVAQAVVELISEGGVRAVTVDAVSKRSKVAKTTMYRHWSSREDMVTDILSSTLPEQLVPDTGTLVGDLEALAQGLAEALSDRRLASVIGAIAILDGDDRLNELRRLTTTARHQIVRDVIARARERGDRVSGGDVDDIVCMIAGPLFYRCFVEGILPGKDFAARCVSQTLHAESEIAKSNCSGEDQ